MKRRFISTHNVPEVVLLLLAEQIVVEYVVHHVFVGRTAGCYGYKQQGNVSRKISKWLKITNIA